MKKTIALLTLIVILLSGCSESVPSSASVTSTQTFTAQTNTESPTSTIIPDPLASTPEGTTGINSAGQWIKNVTENGYEYEYIYSAELGQWVREVSNFPLMDYPQNNFIPYRIFVADNVNGERSLVSMTHKDFTIADIPSSGTFNPPPLSSLEPTLRDRYFESDRRQLSDQEKQIAFQYEMAGKGEGDYIQAYLPIVVSNGQEMLVKLSETTGINLIIIDADTMKKLGGNNVITLNQGSVTFYVEVYGVDQAGNELVRLAFDDSVANISTDDLRKILFSIPGNFMDHKDQREQGFTPFAQVMANYSDDMQSDGITPDVVINRMP